MQWTAEITHPMPLRFVIEKEQLHNLTDNRFEDGYYLYVYDGERNTHDYLQDTLQFAKDQALEEFGVPLSAWRQVG